ATSTPVRSPKPNARRYAYMSAAPSLLATKTAPAFAERSRICVTVVGPYALPSAFPRRRPPMIAKPLSSYVVCGVTTRLSRAAAIVIAFMVEPGSYAHETARSRSASASAVATRAGSEGGHEAEDVRAERPVRIEPLSLVLEAEPLDAQRGDPPGDVFRKAPAQVEPLRPRVQRRADRLHALPECGRERCGGRAAVRDAPGDGVQRAQLDRRGEDRAAPIAHDAALRREDEVAAGLIGRLPEELAPADRLPVRESAREQQARDREDGEERTKTNERHRHRHPF